MQSVQITIERRDERGKGPARRLRAAGRFPCVLYGPRREATLLSGSIAEFKQKLGHLEGTHLVKLLADGSPDVNGCVVLIREAQQHPVTTMPLHVDFLEIDLAARLTVTVAIHLVGRAEGVVAGGILQPVVREIEVDCLPSDIPEFIEVDVTALAIHDSLHVRDLTLPADVLAVTDGAQTLVTVVEPTAEELPADAEAEGAGEAGTEAAPAAEGTEPEKEPPSS